MHLRCRFMSDTCRRSSGCLDPHIVSTTCRHCFLMKWNKSVGKNVWKTCCLFRQKNISTCFEVFCHRVSLEATNLLERCLFKSLFRLLPDVSKFQSHMPYVSPYALCCTYPAQSYIHQKKTIYQQDSKISWCLFLVDVFSLNLKGGISSRFQAVESWGDKRQFATVLYTTPNS